MSSSALCYALLVLGASRLRCSETDVVWCSVRVAVCLCVRWRCTDWSSQRWIPLPPLISDGHQRESSMSEPVSLVVLGNSHEDKEDERPEAWSHVL